MTREVQRICDAESAEEKSAAPVPPAKCTIEKKNTHNQHLWLPAQQQLPNVSFMTHIHTIPESAPDIIEPRGQLSKDNEHQGENPLLDDISFKESKWPTQRELRSLQNRGYRKHTIQKGGTGGSHCYHLGVKIGDLMNIIE